MAVFVTCFAVNMPLGVVQQVQLDYQEGFINGLWESAGKVLGLAGLLLVIYLKTGLVWLVLVVAGAPGVAWLFNSFVLFGYRRPWLRPQWSLVSSPVLKGSFGLAFSFFATGYGSHRLQF